MMSQDVVIILSSPTASGKTTVALNVSDHIPTEIISADSRQVFKHTTIGTAKPSAEQLQQVPHHFIDSLEPDENWSAGKFAEHSRILIKKILKQKKIPFVVGGTGLYIKALVDGIANLPEPNTELRQNLVSRYEQHGLESIVSELKQVDPESIHHVDLQNPRRVLRALEIYYMTGMTRGELETQSDDPLPYPVLWFGLNWNRDILYQRIEERVDRMIADGLTDEVKGLLERGYTNKTNALQSVGYVETIEYLNGRLSEDEAINLIKQNTRRYARRQMTWFRKEKRIRWLDIQSEADLEIAAGEIVQQYRKLTQK